MYCLGAVGRACGRGLHRAPTRALALSAARPGTGSPELDQLILASSSDKLVAPPLPSPTYTSPLTGDASPLLHADPSAAASEYMSPFASVEKVDFTNLAEPSLQSLGLAHQWPSGWMQSALELMHVDLGLPWWQAIVATTVCLRIVAWPILVIAQRNMANMNNHAPTVQKLQVQASLAAARGDQAQVDFNNAALKHYMDEHNVHPVKSMLPLWANGLFITSMFFGLRGMTNAPVESLTTGGTAWFTDLVATDPTFVLPLTAAATVGLMMYLGADGISLDTMPPIMKKVN
jgi:YidC/Oxa1 family membrane protein insertase